MRRKPLIGITMSRRDKDGTRESINVSYIEAVSKAGGVPVPLTNSASGVELAGYCDGILLPGGGDIDPSLYGDKPDGTEMSSVEAERDRTEREIVLNPEFAEKPVLGICRGIQALSVFLGGKLIQDIPAYQKSASSNRTLNHRQKEHRSQFSHYITINEGSRLYSIFGTGSRMVNSLHHQSVKTPPPGWNVTAFSDDGIVEAMELPGNVFKVAVQWHPEELIGHCEMDMKLFESFVRSAAEYAESAVNGNRKK
ncbi:MAG: gamma-glutamyl-gamma-aminobutyrate hydrolase family protein [Thermoplasmata archaeon]|nr:gamma-glutamyl-gamma-aminobutyrate hydrolase family protein [Candidatus Sysuiplasma jiujiangense]